MKSVGTSLARRAPTWSERERVRCELEKKSCFSVGICGGKGGDKSVVAVCLALKFVKTREGREFDMCVCIVLRSTRLIDVASETGFCGIGL